MPAQDEIKDAATNRRSSNTSMASSFGLPSSNDNDEGGFLPLLDLIEWKGDANVYDMTGQCLCKVYGRARLLLRMISFYVN